MSVSGSSTRLETYESRSPVPDPKTLLFVLFIHFYFNAIHYFITGLSGWARLWEEDDHLYVLGMGKKK